MVFRSKIGWVFFFAVAVFAALVRAPAPGLSDPSPFSGPEAGAPRFIYLLSSAEHLGALSNEFDLGVSAKEKVAAAVEDEARRLARLERASESIINSLSHTSVEKKLMIQAARYNERAAIIERSAFDRVSDLLRDRRGLLPWVEREWAAEVSAHGIGSFDVSATGVKHRVFATQYEAFSDYEVAIPDKYIKFANLDWEHAPGYSGSNYRVDLELNGREVKGVKILDVGPWNIDDNYWNEAGAAVRPRRRFTDLPVGMPESQAAFFNDYNGGKDQFGRAVLNPAGIDLSPDVAADLGLNYLQNAWIDVVYKWETAGALAAKVAAPKYSTSLSKSRTFVVAWRLIDLSLNSSVASYDVQKRPQNRRTWQNWRVETSSRRAKFTGKAGLTYFFRVRARGVNGEIGAWSRRKKTIIPYDQNHIMTARRGFAFQFYGPNSSYYLNSVRYSRTKGTFVKFKFTGKSVALISRRGPLKSRAKIYLDGKYVQTIDAYASARKGRRVLWRKWWPNTGTHILKVVNLATSGRKRFDIDGLAIGR